MKAISYAVIALTVAYTAGLITLLHSYAQWSIVASVAVSILPGLPFAYVSALVTFALLHRLLSAIRWLN